MAPLDPEALPRVAGHAFDRLGLDARCCRQSQHDKTLQCEMTRGELFKATEADIDKYDSFGGYADGFAHYGRLSRGEYDEIQADRGRYEKWLEAIMDAVREVSG